MSKNEHGLCRTSPRYQVTEKVKVVSIVAKPTDIATKTFGSPVPTLIKRIHGEPARHNVVHEVPVPTAMFEQAVDDEDDRPGRSLGLPALHKEARAIAAAKPVL
jgi:hypothetical protein